MLWECAAGPSGLLAVVWREVPPLGKEDRPARRCRGMVLFPHSQGGATGLQIPRMALQKLANRYSSPEPEEDAPESPLFHILSQHEESPVHPEIGTGYSAGHGIFVTKRGDQGP